MTVPQTTQTQPSWIVNPFFSVERQRPFRQLIYPPSTSVTYPFGQGTSTAEEAALAYPVIIETFRRLAEAVLVYAQPEVFSPQEELPNQIQRPREQPLQNVKEALIFLRGEIQRTFQPPQTLPKEVLAVLVQIPVLLEQVENLLQEVKKENPSQIPLNQNVGGAPLLQPEQRPVVGVPVPALAQEVPPKALPNPQEAPELQPPPLARQTSSIPLPVKGAIFSSENPLLQGVIKESVGISVPGSVFAEIQQKIPSFVRSLSEAFPFLPSTVTPKINEILLSPFVRNPAQESSLIFQSVNPLLRGTPLERNVALETVLQKTGYFIPSLVGAPVIIQREFDQRVLRVYPNYIPAVQTPVTITPINPAILEGFLPPILPGIAIPREGGIAAHVENMRQTPPFSTEIPFAFIVPYQPYFPIKSYPSAAAIPKIEVRPIEDKMDGEDAGEGMSIQLLSYVPEGKTWFGDPFNEGELDERPLRVLSVRKFAIGTYLVTVEQFAEFLTAESKRSGVHLDVKGQVFNSTGDLLCQVKSGNSASDLDAERHSSYLAFKPIIGKEFYPITLVTYLGAKAFCEATGFRLPTEVEWEKAAGVKVDDEKKPIQKFRFGFSRDEIDPSLASYAMGGKEFLETTPVGFYNGRGICSKGGSVFSTSNAISPYGCYDMSGNVWEWTDAGEEARAIIKGGCFESQPQDLRVSARKWKDKDSMDCYTGFRVALS